VTVGVVRFNLWMPVLAARFDEAVDRFRSADGMVVDLRGNLGGVAGLVMGTAGHFLDRRVDLGTMKTRESEMRFYANPRLVTADGRRVTPFAGPLAILVDARTASTSEVFAGGLQDLGRARVFGSRTAGAVLPALMERLPSGDVLYHAVADYRTPSGVVLEGRGVIPDEIVPVTREDLLAGRDAALEAALDWMARETTQEDAR
jgi:carboxyl-terminal processing protease